jgi:hypothetical protein
MDWVQCLTIIVSFAGLVLYLHKEHRENMQNSNKEHKESLEKMESKWIVLFERFHIFDKDVEKFRVKGD